MLKDLLIPAGLLGGLGLIFGLLLVYASKKFAVASDERIDAVRAVLPGANCGACGFSGCDGFAEAAVKGKATCDGCPVGGAAVAEQVGAILGKEVDTEGKKVARVMCIGTHEKARKKYDYLGIKDCESASELHGSERSCNYGCVGYGNCVKACPFDAIILKDGIAEIVEEKCTGCEMCVDACPKSIIKMVPETSRVTTFCSSFDNAKTTRHNCDVGCIKCKRCGKVCPVDAIYYEDGLSRIDPDKCINCGECIKVCPTNVILESFIPVGN